MAAVAILDLCFGEPRDYPRSLIRGAYFLRKFCHDRLGSFQVIRIWIFSRSGLKVLFTPPKFQFLGILPQKFRGTLLRPPKGTSLRGTMRFEPSLVQIWRTVRPVALAKKTNNRKKTVANWLFAQTTFVAISKSKFACRVASGVWFYRSSFIKFGPVIFPLWVVENRSFPLLWPLAYTTACTTV